jgi:DNA-binding XRE family transcriptional regulator
MSDIVTRAFKAYINPSATRIQCVRGYRMMSKSELARLVGVNPNQITAWEDYEYRSGPGPTDEQVLKIAEALNWPAEFFYGDELEIMPEEAISFHKKIEY